MPNDNIKRSIMKASGELGNVDYEEITYEGYAPGGVAVIVEAITDSRNRTASDVPTALPRTTVLWALPAALASCSTRRACW